jgi:RNA polymerase sigma factor (sigma-70 family)
MDSGLHTTLLLALLDRVRQGDRDALDELLRRASVRLKSLARSMLRRFPRVRQHEQSADVVQETTLGLLGALREIHFSSTREFYGLVGEHVRRRLLDLARRYARPVNDPMPLASDGSTDEGPCQPEEGDLDRWQALHEAVEGLPVECREVFSLRFYHGREVREVAQLLQVSTRTVMRTWSRTLLALSERLGEGGLPNGLGAPEL